jgi:hypothetical protein
MAQDWDRRGYTYAAAVHCVACAAPQVADTLGDTGRDSDEPHPIFESEEAPPQGEYCGTCGDTISDPYDSADLGDVLCNWSLNSGHNEECGSATEGAGWAGLFTGVTAQELRDEGLFGTAEGMAHSDTKAYVLYCDPQGFFSHDSFDSDAEALVHWAAVQAKLEPEQEGTDSH